MELRSNGHIGDNTGLNSMFGYGGFGGNDLWILDSGFWDDMGRWEDDDFWRDA